jgi:hypothetical protein
VIRILDRGMFCVCMLTFSVKGGSSASGQVGCVNVCHCEVYIHWETYMPVIQVLLLYYWRYVHLETYMPVTQVLLLSYWRLL